MTVPAKVDRDEVFLEYTKSICPVCKVVIDAEVNIRDNRVVMRKRCPEHGPFEALIYSDAELYMAQLRYNKPGTIPLEFQTEVRDGCPLDCGLCPEHKQHACLGIIEVNSGCNLDCPICFADSGHQPDGYALTQEQVSLMLDTFVRSEGEPEVVMFSGGEPTIHPEIVTFIAMAQERGIRSVMLNTNGIRLARDPRFVDELAELGPHVYLQFDGFERETHLAMRGKDLRADKERALEACERAGLHVTLVAALEKGVNEHEAGAIVRFGVGHPAVMSVAFQPVTHSGRHAVFDPLERLTNADVMKLVAEQVPEWYRVSDFVPVPCCFPTCRSMSYALVGEDGVVPFTRILDIEQYLDYVSNRFFPDASVRGAFEKMFSSSAAPGADSLLQACRSCGLDPGAFADMLDDPWRKLFVVVIQDFQDPYTLNVRQLMKCCVEEITPDGRLIPFCAYNSVGYREQVRAQLSGVQVAPVVPNALPLQPILEPTRYGSRTVAGNGSERARNATNVGRRLSS
ncbi:MAG: radical SAM protein [Actinobacteria bacterium]|nr:radical SAM protein [Actinomycetota bacterium]